MQEHLAMTASYALMDTDTFNMVGSFRSRAAALRAVAQTARQYGADSPEARSLVLFRQDGPADDARIAEGDELVRLALAAEAPAKHDGAAPADALIGRVRPRSSASGAGRRMVP
jgi:hypothetical protein